MIGKVARWGHNTLLIGLALMTSVIFLSLYAEENMFRAAAGSGQT